MTLYFKIKALSRRKPLVERTPFVIDETVSTSNTLIEYLGTDELENSAKTGKIGFMAGGFRHGNHGRRKEGNS